MSIRNVSKFIQKILYLEPVSMPKFVPFRYFGTKANPSLENNESDVNKKIIDNQNSILYEKNLHPRQTYSQDTKPQMGMEDLVNVSSTSKKQSEKPRTDIKEKLIDNENEILNEKIIKQNKQNLSSETQPQRGMSDLGKTSKPKKSNKEPKVPKTKRKSKNSE